MAEQQTQRNLFSTLKRLFSTDVIIRNDGGELKTVDVEKIQVDGVLQTNALVDRFNRIYTTSTSYGVKSFLSLTPDPPKLVFPVPVISFPPEAVAVDL